MPPRPASSCSRALRRQLASPLESNVWLSDALLATAFERYFAVSHVPRRRASSTPGPLESRRRLGKRRIGDLNAGYAPSSLPDWASPTAFDLSDWKWEPPTLVSVREARRQAQLQLAEHWLGKWMVPSSVGEQSLITEPPPLPTLVESLDQFRLRVSGEPLPDLRQACDDICLQFQNGTVSVAERAPMVALLGHILEALNERFESSSDALALIVPLYSVVIGRLFPTAAETLSPADGKMGQRLLAELSELPAGDQLCNLLECTMRIIPASQRDDTAMHVGSTLDKSFLSWNEAAMNTKISLVQIQSIAGALSLLGATKPSIFRAAEQLLLALSGTSLQQYRTRCAWLNVLARVRLREGTGNKAFLRSLSTLLGDRAIAATVSTMDICKLLMNYWSSSGRIQDGARMSTVFEKLSAFGEATSCAALAEALHSAHPKWESMISEMCDALRRLGRLDELATSFRELAEHHILSRRLLRKVAVACDDYRTALSLHDLYRKLPKKKSSNLWDKGMWSGYLDQALCDPAAHAENVWRLLRLCEPTDKTAKIAAKLAYEEAHSGNLSGRATLRRVENCIALLRNKQQQLPPQALVAAYHAVTRDLAEKELGRTSRLLWFVNLVRQEYGPERAEECRNMLRSWRQLVSRVKARDEPGRAGEDADEGVI